MAIDRWIGSLERRLAAIARQYRRALAADDQDAQQLEKDVAGERIQRLLVNFLMETPIEVADFFLSGYAECRMDFSGQQMRAVGRIWCSFPDTFRDWNDPFLATMELSEDGSSLLDYTICLGTRASLFDLSTVQRRILEEGPLAPPPPTHPDDWAFTFRMGDLTD